METFLSAVLADLLSRSISFVIDRYCQQQQGVEENLQQLQRMLLRIQIVVEEANRRSITNQAMLMQLKTMRSMIYRGYYFLDNFRYRITPEQTQDEVGEHSVALSHFSPLKRFRFSTITKKMVSEVQERKELQTLLDHLQSIISEEFVISLSSCPRMIRQPHCSYLLLENCMFGRQAEQERVISFLLEPHPLGVEGAAVLPIIGPKRVGKSTLVEHVCHDERIPGVIKHQNSDSTEQSLVVIELVDDMDKGTWRKILHSLRRGSRTPVTRIIITSQSERVATFGTTEALWIDFLPKEAFWYFFKTIAFGSTNPHEDPKLTSICMEIALLVNGSFVGTNIVGGILRSNISVQFWNRFLERMKAITDRHFRLLGQHLRDAYTTKSGRSYVWVPKLNRFVAATYNLYEVTSARLNDLPIILSNDILTGNVELKEKFDVLQWQSSIPPYNYYMAHYEMIAQPPDRLPKMKRSRSLSEELV
uniref:Disease resistance N-terminal domain-containing protein n=1 Tax=Oryza punctata TaxID=4537 RepID=A0A0E0K2L7_ORYPU